MADKLSPDTMCFEALPATANDDSGPLMLGDDVDGAPPVPDVDTDVDCMSPCKSRCVFAENKDLSVWEG